MRKKIIFAAIAALLTLGSITSAQEQMWVTSDSLNRRTCPSEACGIVGRLFFREAATVFERSNGWARVSKYYDASCQAGKSDYVNQGNSTCDEANGIRDGQSAEWVSDTYLAANRPSDPSEVASGTAKLIGQSDDFRIYRDAFVKATDSLIASGQCSEQDFADMGGWVKSTNRGAGVYFTYCRGGVDRVYLNAATGKIFR